MNRTALRTEASDRWTVPVAVLLLLLAVLFVAYRDTGLAMVAIWSRSDTFAHAFLVPPIVLWLVWRKRAELAACAPRPSPWMLLAIAVAGAAWLVGDLAAANAVAQLAFTALVVFVVVAVIGVRASRAIAFPLAFLFFSVPVGEFLMPQMMQWTADFTVLALRLTGIPVYREGLQFVVPSGNWSVVEACSGIRYLIASVMVGTLFAYLNYRSMRRRWVFVGISVLVPIVANWVRAYLIVLMGDLSGNAAAVSADHLIYGWVFFGVVISLMFLIGARWSEPDDVGVSRPAAIGVSVGRGVDRRRRTGAAWGLAVAVLLVAPHLALGGMQSTEREGVPELALPASLAGGWRLAPDDADRWNPAFKGATVEVNRFYARPGSEPVGIYIAYYRHQNYANKLVSSENRVVTLHDAAWSFVSRGRRTLTVGGQVREFETSLLLGTGHIATATGRHLSVWKTYWIDDQLTASETSAKARVAVERLLGRGDDAAVLMVYVRSETGVPDDAAIADFLGGHLDELTAQLAKARDHGVAVVPAPASSSATLRPIGTL